MAGEPVIAIVIGSRNDEEHLKVTFEILDSMGIPWEKAILSAHRQPEALYEYILEADGRGIRIFIAAAGLSAALPGVIASRTLRPVIGVPVPTGPLQGIDALLSILQMPNGVPVATMGLGSQGPRNAALLAAGILALEDKSLLKKLKQRRDMLKAG